jgi:hypothetical protein
MERLSTSRLDLFPSINELEKICKSVYVIELILRTYVLDFEKLDNNTFTYSKEDSSGSYFNIFFNKFGCIILGCTPDSGLYPLNNNNEYKSISGLIEDVPDEFKQFLKFSKTTNIYYYEPYNSYSITYCIWRKYTDVSWNIGKINVENWIENYFPYYDDNYDDVYTGKIDGSEENLFFLSGDPNLYIEWSESSSGGNKFSNVDIRAIQSIFSFEPLTDVLVKKINPTTNLSDIKKYVREVGYPIDV